MTRTQMIDELIDVRDMLETLQSYYNIPDIDPLWADPIDKLNKLLEDLEE